MSVYDNEAFEERVNYAASVISKGIVPMNGRVFDTCFEMNDGDFVAAALVRRKISHPDTKLAANLFRFIGEEIALKNYQDTLHLSRKELRDAAAQARREAKETFDKWMEERGVAQSAQ